MTGFQLENVVAIVTGGASGLGRAMTLGLARAGATVVATASQSRKALDAVAAAVNREIGRDLVVPVLGSVTEEADCRRIVQDAVARFGKVDVLVNNAGRGMKYVSDSFLTQPTRFWEVEPNTWKMIIDTNVNGPYLMARAVIPHMLSNGWGRVVNISMNFDTMRRQGFSPYGPSKAALESETIIWAQDLKDSGITVNALLPGGAVSTGMIPPGVSSDIRARLLSPDVVIPPLLWLASPRSNGVTGQRIIATEWKSDTDSENEFARSKTADAGWA